MHRFLSDIALASSRFSSDGWRGPVVANKVVILRLGREKNANPDNRLVGCCSQILCLIVFKAAPNNEYNLVLARTFS